MTKIYVLYHAHCTDGTGSKFAAWKKFGKTAQYISVAYGKPMPEMEPGSEVYIIDFSYPRAILEALHATHKSVVVLDHHKTAEEDLRGLEYCHFDMTRSGCVMAWEYFHPNTLVPNLLLDIQDRDLWKFKRSNSKAVHAGLSLLEGDMSKWNRLVNYGGHYNNLVLDGETLLKHQDKTVASYVKNKIKVIDFDGYRCGITNSGDLSSEIGSGICQSKELNVDFACIYCITSNNDVLLSLRSIGDFDVSAIAKQFGGGGHKSAAGAVTNLETLMNILNETVVVKEGAVSLGWEIQSKTLGRNWTNAIEVLVVKEDDDDTTKPLDLFPEKKDAEDYLAGLLEIPGFVTGQLVRAYRVHEIFKVD